MIRDLRLLCFMLAFMTGGLACGWTYHAHVITQLESRIDQLEEDMNDQPSYDPAVETEDVMLEANETEI